MNAYEELMEELEEHETVEAVVFGSCGWGGIMGSDEGWKPGFGEPEHLPIPLDKRGKIMTLEEAEPFMRLWSQGFGAPESYAIYVWTNRRIIWVEHYHGRTRLINVPRNPQVITDFGWGE